MELSSNPLECPVILALLPELVCVRVPAHASRYEREGVVELISRQHVVMSPYVRSYIVVNLQEFSQISPQHRVLEWSNRVERGVV